jgi:sec-independent protein translocase protein TatA
MGDLFDSPWKILIIVVLILVLFGGKKLPGAAKSLGQSMKIFKAEIADLHKDEPGVETPAPAQPTAMPAAQLTAAPVSSVVTDQQQAQIDALQQQIRDMQRQAAMDPVASSVKDDI